MAMVWAWCRKRSRIAPAVGTSPRSLPHSSSGRLLDMMAGRNHREDGGWKSRGKSQGNACQGNNPENAFSHSLDNNSPDFALDNVFERVSGLKILAKVRDPDRLHCKDAERAFVLCSAIYENSAFLAKFSESPSPMTNDKFSMTNSQFRFPPLVAACRAVTWRLCHFALKGLFHPGIGRSRLRPGLPSAGKKTCYLSY